MNRYETSAAREFDRALRQLIAIRKTDFTQKRDHVCPPTKVIFCGNKWKCDPDDLRPDCHHRADTNGEPAPAAGETNPIPQSDSSAERPQPEQTTANNASHETNPIPQSDNASDTPAQLTTQDEPVSQTNPIPESHTTPVAPDCSWVPAIESIKQR